MPSEMKLLSVRKAQKTHPTGDPKFAVMQAYPAGLSEKESVRSAACLGGASMTALLFSIAR